MSEDNAVWFGSLSVPVFEGDYLKVLRNGESFWISFISMDNETGFIYGAVENNLINNLYSLGAKINVHNSEVLDVMDAVGNSRLKDMSHD